MGAGVGDNPRNSAPSPHPPTWRERQRSLWSLEALCGHGDSVEPKHPAPTEHVGITHSMGPLPSSRDETRTIFPSLVTSRGLDTAISSTVGGEISAVPGDGRTLVLCW